jgi:hypothetical protein
MKKLKKSLLRVKQKKIDFLGSALPDLEVGAIKG